MTRARRSAKLQPHTTLDTAKGRIRFFHGDCLEVLAALGEATVSAIVTSPPYNLGDPIPELRGHAAPGRLPGVVEPWIAAARRVLQPQGSLFLNVGAKPTDPWTAFDVAQAARPHLQLQNTIHWVKSIAIDHDWRCRADTWRSATTSRSTAPVRERLP